MNTLIKEVFASKVWTDEDISVSGLLLGIGDRTA